MHGCTRTEFNKAEIERLRKKAEEIAAVRDTSSKITNSEVCTRLV